MSQAAYRINGQLVDRAAFYTVACDPARSVAVVPVAVGKTREQVKAELAEAVRSGQPPAHSGS